MTRAFLLAALAAATLSSGAFAYSKSEETQGQDTWFEDERVRTEGYKGPRSQAVEGATEATCPTIEQMRRDAEFLRQLQLTDGSPIAVQPFPERYASGDSIAQRQIIAMNCEGHPIT